jgi:hypothetical protein
MAAALSSGGGGISWGMAEDAVEEPEEGALTLAWSWIYIMLCPQGSVKMSHMAVILCCYKTPYSKAPVAHNPGFRIGELKSIEILFEMGNPGKFSNMGRIVLFPGRDFASLNGIVLTNAPESHM